MHLAHVLKRQGEPEEAAKAFESALHLNPLDSESAGELFDLRSASDALERQTDPGQGAPASPLGKESKGGMRGPADEVVSPALQVKMQEAEIAKLKALVEELEDASAGTLQLAALQVNYEDVQAENVSLRLQIDGQQQEIADQNDELERLNALEERLNEMALSLDEAARQREEALAQVKTVQDKMRDYEQRIGLAREEFLRSEGQIALIKDLVLRESGL